MVTVNSNNHRTESSIKETGRRIKSQGRADTNVKNTSIMGLGSMISATAPGKMNGSTEVATTVSSSKTLSMGMVS